MGPRERNDVFQMAPVGIQPWIEMNQEDASRFQNTMDLQEDVLDSAQVLDGIDRIGDVDTMVRQGNRGCSGLDQLHFVPVVFPGHRQQRWIKLNADRVERYILQ